MIQILKRNSVKSKHNYYSSIFITIYVKIKENCCLDVIWYRISRLKSNKYDNGEQLWDFFLIFHKYKIHYLVVTGTKQLGLYHFKKFYAVCFFFSSVPWYPVEYQYFKKFSVFSFTCRFKYTLTIKQNVTWFQCILYRMSQFFQNIQHSTNIYWSIKWFTIFFK